MMKVTVDRRRLRQRMIEEDKNSLIKALKQDDAKAAKEALTAMSGEDLGLDSKSFNRLAQEIEWANNPDHNRDTKGQPANLDNVRQLLKVGKDVKQTTSTHNPITNQPWSSGPAKQGQQKKQISLTPEEKDVLLGYPKRMWRTGWTNITEIDKMEYYELSYLFEVIVAENDINPKKEYESIITKITNLAQVKFPNEYKDSDFPDI